MFKWIQLALENFKVIISILVLLGVSGVSIYGNVNEFNPWSTSEVITEEKPKEESKEEPKLVIVPKPQSNANALLADALMAEHIKEYH